VKLSVVIPARNEAGNIGPTIDGICQRLRREEITYEVVVVDDGSSDDTPNEVRARSQVDPGVVLVHNTPPHGFGMAVRRGLDAFTGDAVAIMMADGSDSPDDLVKYYYVLRDRAECAFGSRFIPGGGVYGYPRGKLVVNRVANWFVRVLFGLRFNDVTNAFKAYRADVIDGCRPFLSPHFNLTVELPLKAVVRGYSYETVPITWRTRKIGMSSLHLQEQGSRYLFIVLHVLLEKLLTRGDYRRRDAAAPPAVVRRDDGTTRMVAGPEAF
jgi:dolichol-phosphate mannosyltransferase